MQANRILCIILIFSLNYLTCVTAFAKNEPTQNDPVALLKYIANNMITELKANKATLKNKPQIVYGLAYKYVVPYADLPLMSKRVVPPLIWNNATPEQRAQFQKQFTTTVIRTYASALTSYQDQVIHFFPLRGNYQGARTIEVNSEINSSLHEPIRVNYRLVRVGNIWKLYDMSVEGVSLIASFRSQFADILAQGNMNQLLNRMSTHNQR